MKRIIGISLALLMLTALLAGCATGTNAGKSGAGLKVGMVTDSGTIDDKSFNEGTWNGIKKAVTDFGITEKYLQPNGEAESDYMQEITNLYDAGYKVIVTPGFKFETTIYEAQDKYPDATFVILDGEPHSADYSDFKMNSNVLSYYFAEEQAGFLVGIATSLEVGSGELGFIGGMAVPAVQRFNWGFQQGITYANDNFGTSCNISPDNCIYQGTFTEIAAGQQLAATMYDRGVKAIFAAAGGVGVGVINEGKERRMGGQDVWVIGVDGDQYDQGKYDGDKSCILTSAMKGVDTATYDTIKNIIDNKFEGGKSITYNASNDGIGIPATNPNLSDDTTKKVNDVFAKLKDGSVKVQATEEGLIP